jgi:hypothetical protein
MRTAPASCPQDRGVRYSRSILPAECPGEHHEHWYLGRRTKHHRAHLASTAAWLLAPIALMTLAQGCRKQQPATPPATQPSPAQVAAILQKVQYIGGTPDPPDDDGSVKIRRNTQGIPTEILYKRLYMLFDKDENAVTHDGIRVDERVYAIKHVPDWPVQLGHYTSGSAGPALFGDELGAQKQTGITYTIDTDVYRTLYISLGAKGNLPLHTLHVKVRFEPGWSDEQIIAACSINDNVDATLVQPDGTEDCYDSRSPNGVCPGWEE